MAKLLVAKGKYNTLFFDISTPEQEHRVWLALAGFNMMQMYYCNIGDDEPDQKAALAGARAGDWESAKWLCELRDDYEYEEWHIEHTVSESEMARWAAALTLQDEEEKS